MPRYAYEAITDSGRIVTGEIDAESSDIANGYIIQKGYIPSRLRLKRETGIRLDWSRVKELLSPVKTRDLILFTKQFRTMIRAGVPMMELLNILETQTENRILSQAIAKIAQDIKEGASIHVAFSKHPKIFSPLYCSVIQAGEKSGSLADVLERMAYVMAREHETRSNVKAMLRYPIFVLTFLAIAFFVLLIFVMPKFVKIFQMRGMALPMPTKVCLFVYTVVTGYWPLILTFGGAVLVGCVVYFRTEKGANFRDRLIINMPIFGNLVVKSIMARFSSIFSILQFSGVPVLESLTILSGTIGNRVIANEFDKIRINVERGGGLAGPMKAARHFPAMVINMIAVGEQTEKLDMMLRDVASHYDGEVEYAIKEIMDSVSPLLTVGISIVVGFFALSIFLPMWDMTKMVR